MSTENNTQLSKTKLIESFAMKYQIEANQVLQVLRGTIIKADKEGKQATNEEIAAFLMVADRYKLNPFTKEIYAFTDPRAGVVPIVSTDGWTHLMTEHDDYKTHSFRYAEKFVTLEGAKPCPEWCEVVIERMDGSQVVIREYLDEVYRPAFEGKYGKVNGPWQTHTKRMLRHKTKIQGAREAFGFSGIYDEDEAVRIIEVQPTAPALTDAGPAAAPVVSIKGAQPPAQIQAPTPQSPVENAVAGQPEGKTDPLKSASESSEQKPPAPSNADIQVEKVRKAIILALGEKEGRKLIINTLGVCGYERYEQIPSEKGKREYLEALLRKHQAVKAQQEEMPAK